MSAAQLSNAVQTFNFEGRAPVRTIMQGDEPWFVAVDVAEILGHRDATTAIRYLDEDEKGTLNARTPSGEQPLLAISESGLYTLILRSRKAQAKPFRRWVTHEVLPALRKDGHYEAPQPALSDLQGQITELRTVLESRAVRVGPSKQALQDLRTTELALEVAHSSIGNVLAEIHRVMHRYHLKTIGASV